MANRLAQSNSPYLLQHAENPVDWYPWGEEALEKAQAEDKPIFLSIGYAACHWCHVMAHESFEDPDTAAFMNENFVNIKVDREERPDLDNIYMNAVVALTGQGGWPMSVFLTPEGQPFYGGTYFPPTRRYNMPSFREVLASIARAWKEERQQVLSSSEQIAGHLAESSRFPVRSQGPLEDKNLKDASFQLVQAYDWKYGGWGQAPKFPQPMAIEFLLRQAVRGDKLALEVAEHALLSMAQGGMYDLVGGGFARYSTDNEWLVPHFEKMLYDNAQLARAYLHAYLQTGREQFRRVCTRTLDFITRELMAPLEEGKRPHWGIYSSLDADSEGEEGKFYVWTPDEIRAVLDEQDAGLVMAAYGVSPGGNFEGRNVFQRQMSNPEIAGRFNLPEVDVQPRLEAIHQQLLEAREQRVRPGTDDKVLVAWNALALAAFAEAARYLDRPDYLETARQNADFLLSEMQSNDRLLRSWRNGQAQHNAYLEDYAGLILGLLALYQSDPDLYWYNSAVQLAADMLTHFKDPEGGFFDTRDDHGPLFTRPKDIQDNAVPSGNALAATALVQLAAYTARGDWRDQAEEMLAAVLSSAVRYPTGFGQWLCALDAAIGPIYEVAIIGPQESGLTQALLDVLWDRYRPNVLAACSEFPPPSNAPPLLDDRPLVEGRPTAYVCQQFICQYPVNTPEGLREQLDLAARNLE